MATNSTATRAHSNRTEQFDAYVNNALVEAGDRFGLYAALASLGPSTTEQVARRTGIAAEPLKHWLRDQAHAGYVDYDRATGRFSLWCDISRN